MITSACNRGYNYETSSCCTVLLSIMSLTVVCSKVTHSYRATIRSCQGIAPDSDTKKFVSIVRCCFAPKVGFLSEVEGRPINLGSVLHAQWFTSTS